jgi:GAF domain-containing protein
LRHAFESAPSGSSLCRRGREGVPLQCPVETPRNTEDLSRFQLALQSAGLFEGLRYLNGRTPFRFTGVYRFDGDTLRNVALFDRWTPLVRQGADAPVEETFCAIVKQVGDAVQVSDGRTDSRFPWMADNAVVSYCGALIRDAQGRAVGTLCHFDRQPVEPPSSELALLKAAAPLVVHYLL